MSLPESLEIQAPKGLYSELVDTFPRHRGLGNLRAKRVIRISDPYGDNFLVSVQVRTTRGSPDHRVYNFYLDSKDRVRKVAAAEMRLVDDHWLPRELPTPSFSKILREIRTAQRTQGRLKLDHGPVSFS